MNTETLINYSTYLDFLEDNETVGENSLSVFVALGGISF